MGKGQASGRTGIPTQLSPVFNPEHLPIAKHAKVTVSSNSIVLLLFVSEDIYFSKIYTYRKIGISHIFNKFIKNYCPSIYGPVFLKNI